MGSVDLEWEGLIVPAQKLDAVAIYHCHRPSCVFTIIAEGGNNGLPPNLRYSLSQTVAH